MWRYLILNSLWFSILFFVHFFGAARSQFFVFSTIFIGAAYLAGRSAVDPFAWSYYFAFSLLVFWSAFQFRRWALARSVALDGELDLLSRWVDQERATLSRWTSDTETIARQAGEVTHLCDKIKEMSQSLNRLETFLVYGEALSRDIKFGQIKLILFEEARDKVCPVVEEAYALSYSDFQGSFDRSVWLKDRAKASAALDEFDKKIVEKLSGHPKRLSDKDFIAYPILLQKELTAALILRGMEPRHFAYVSVITASFISEIQRLRLFDRVENLADTDGLTGVCVRRHLVLRLEEEIQRSKRLGLELSFLMIDIDHFKRFNDEYGHLVGDVVVREVAETIRKNIREVDLVGRYGGEEFGVFLIETDEPGAFFVAERIRRAVAEKSITAYDESLKVTVSIGCATHLPGMEAAALIDAADKAMYEAKHQGRNRVCGASLSGSAQHE